MWRKGRTILQTSGKTRKVCSV